jgi:glycosyltransferase involved in cell wall biosynthesis
MRVLSVIETLRHGGAETVLVDLVSGLREFEHLVIHFSDTHGTEPDSWIADALSHSSIPCMDVPRQAFGEAAARRTILGDFKPDVVLHHWWGQDVLGPWLRSTVAGPGVRRPSFVLVLHRSGIAAPGGYDAYVLVTPTQRPQVARFDPARVHVIPNGVDLSRFASADPGAERRPFTVGRLSNLRHEKIPPDWVRTIAAFGLHGARFVIAGDGPLRPLLESDVHALGLEQHVLLPGYVPRGDVPRLLSTFDVFCYVTSTAVECHPLALLEASAAGVPIVAEARGGVPDIVQHEVNGLLADSAAGIGASLHRLRRDTALRRRLSAGGREVASRFSLERQIEGYANLLRLAARPRGD